MAVAVRGSAWGPFTLVRHFDADFDTLVRRAFGSAAFRPATGSGFVPAADVVRDGADVVVTLSLPGVDVEKDVEVEVAEGRLVVTGTRADRHESTEGGVLVREIRSGGFRREFALPKGVSADRVEADYHDGLLTIRVREVVRPAVRPGKVTVRTALPAGKADAEATVEGTEK